MVGAGEIPPFQLMGPDHWGKQAGPKSGWMTIQQVGQLLQGQETPFAEPEDHGLHLLRVGLLLDLMGSASAQRSASLTRERESASPSLCAELPSICEKLGSLCVELGSIGVDLGAK